MVYFGYHLVNPHVLAVQNMYAKGGQRVFQAELGAAKFKINNGKCSVTKNRYGCNFQNIASKTKQRWLIITYEKPLIHFGTDILEIVAVSVFCLLLFFANGLHFVVLNGLRPTKTGSKKIVPHFHIDFLNPECVRIPCTAVRALV